MENFKVPVTIAISFGLGVLLTLVVERYALESYVKRPKADNQICMEYPDNITRLNLDTLLRETARYGNTHANIVLPNIPQISGSSTNQMPSRSFHIPLEELKSFIFNLQTHYSKVNKDLDVRSLGINFIYTVYSKNFPTNDSQHTLALVPTRLNSAEQMEEFDAISGKPIAEFVKERALNTLIYAFHLPSRFNAAPVPSSTSTSTSSSPFMRNQGGLCPCRTCTCNPNSITSLSDSTYPTIKY